MDDVRTHDAQEPPDTRNGVKDGNPQSQNQQRRIEHATTATVTNDRYTTICTLEIRPSKDDTATAINTIHRRIFDAIKEIDDTAVIITLEQTKFNHGKDMPTTEQYYKTVFTDWRQCHVTKREYVSFQLESTQTISQLKYGSMANGNKGIFDTLRSNSAFLRMRKYGSQTEASIGFFLGINPKLTLRKALKDKIDHIITWLDLDDDDTKLLMKESKKGDPPTQEIIIPAYDIHHKIFSSGNGEDRLTSTVYEIRTSPTHAATLKSILCKASHPDNHPIVQFIPYGIQGITHKDIYKNLIKKQNAFIRESSIIPVYDIEERDIGKFTQKIEESKYIKSIESTNESTSKGKYFMITTKKDYQLAVNEVKAMIKYVYPERKEDERQDYQRGNKPVIHNNVSSYAQVLADFHEETPVPTNNSNKRLKIQFREQTPTSKRDAPKEVTFLAYEDPTPAEDHYGKQTINENRNPTPKEGLGQVAGYDRGGRGGQGGKGYGAGSNHATSNTVQLPNPWRNEVHSMIREMKVDIMKEIKLVITTVISSQLSEIAKVMASEIKTAISMELSTHIN